MPIANIEELKKNIFASLCDNGQAPANCKSVYIDGVRYRSLFVAGIDSDISFRWLAVKMAESQGAPVLIKNHLVVSEEWIRLHLECLI